MSEPKMVGCGHAFEYKSIIPYDEQHHESTLGRLNKLGAEGWEVISLHENRIYLKRKIPSAYELKLIAEAEEAHERLKVALDGLQGGSDGQPTH